MLAKRETARKAFHAADNDMALRRAALRRDRPHRGAYSPGEWVMVWKNTINKGSWIGPAEVIIQDGNNTVFCNNMGSIVRAAPRAYWTRECRRSQTDSLRVKKKILLLTLRIQNTQKT